MEKVVRALSAMDLDSGRKGVMAPRRRCAEALQGCLEHFWEGGRHAEAGVVLSLLKVLRETEFPVLGGVRLEDNNCRNLAAAANGTAAMLAEVTRQRARALVARALGKRLGSKRILHLERQRLLDKAIALLAGVPDSELGLARYHLIRARLVLPRGEAVPPSKIEALNKAVDLLRKASRSTEAAWLTLRISLEAERSGLPRSFSDEELKDALQVTLSSEGFPDYGRLADLEILDFALFHGLINDEYSDSIYFAEDVHPFHPVVYLFKWRASERLRAPDCSQLMELAKFIVGLHFGDPLWKELPSVLATLAGKEKSAAADIALESWASCAKTELMAKLPSELRWHWSGLADLYSFAFRGALSTGRYKEAVRVADSLKSRPAVKLSVLEQTMSREDLGNVYELERYQFSRSFYPEYEGTKKSAVESYRPKLKDILKTWDEKQKMWEKLLHPPEGWAVVHLFLDGQDIYPIVLEHDKAPSNKGAIKYEPLWRAFRDWYSVCRGPVRLPAEIELGRSKPEELTDLFRGDPLCDVAEALCSAVGEHMGFLFDIEHQNILFVPQGFTHLLPLHAACRVISGKREFLFETKASVYLPAAEMGGAFGYETPLPPLTGQKGLFINFEEQDEKNTFVELFESWNGPKVRPATGETFLKHVREQTGVCAVLCHGYGNQENPCLSYLKLKLCGRNLRFTDIDVDLGKSDLTARGIILGACESDLAPARPSMHDEHLSLATPFLRRGASWVVANLWRVNPSLQAEVVEKVAANPTQPHKVLKDLQVAWRNELRVKLDGREGAASAYFFAPFRVMGYGPAKPSGPGSVVSMGEKTEEGKA